MTWKPSVTVAAVVERDGRFLFVEEMIDGRKVLNQPAGHLDPGESLVAACAREVMEETALEVDALKLIGVYEFERMNQVIIAYHALARGEIKLSPELVDYRLYTPETVRCWPAGTGYALADWLKSRGHTPQFIELASRPATS